MRYASHCISWTNKWLSLANSLAHPKIPITIGSSPRLYKPFPRGPLGKSNNQVSQIKLKRTLSRPRCQSRYRVQSAREYLALFFSSWSLWHTDSRSPFLSFTSPSFMQNLFYCTEVKWLGYRRVPIGKLLVGGHTLVNRWCSRAVLEVGAKIWPSLIVWRSPVTFPDLWIATLGSPTSWLALQLTI